MCDTCVDSSGAFPPSIRSGAPSERKTVPAELKFCWKLLKPPYSSSFLHFFLFPSFPGDLQQRVQVQGDPPAQQLQRIRVMGASWQIHWAQQRRESEARWPHLAQPHGHAFPATPHRATWTGRAAGNLEDNRFAWG